jgi:hypothetical protein
MSSSRCWVGVDLDGTLAHYDGWKGPFHIGEPVPAMVEKVQALLREGQEVRIFTARVWPVTEVIGAPVVVPKRAREDSPELEAVYRWAVAIQAWCVEHIGRPLPITCVKDTSMVALWDDRAIQVEKNTGRFIEDGATKCDTDRFARDVVAMLEAELDDRKGLSWGGLDEETLEELRAACVGRIKGLWLRPVSEPR